MAFPVSVAFHVVLQPYSTARIATGTNPTANDNGMRILVIGSSSHSFPDQRTEVVRFTLMTCFGGTSFDLCQILLSFSFSQSRTFLSALCIGVPKGGRWLFPRNPLHSTGPFFWVSAARKPAITASDVRAMSSASRSALACVSRAVSDNR